MLKDGLTYSALNGLLVRASGLLLPLMTRTSPAAAIGVKGLDGRYLMVNPAMEALLHRSQAEILNLADSDLLPPEIVGRLDASERDVLYGAPATIDELVIDLGGGSETVFWQTLPLFDGQGLIRYLCVIVFASSDNDSSEETRGTLVSLRKANEDLRRSVAELNELSGVDRLTGAWNRKRLEESVLSEMDRLKRYDRPLCLLLIDVDFFKTVNDKYGHLAGDRVLKEMTNRITTTIRTSDSLTRWGGEEFVVLCPASTLSTAITLAERLLKTIETASFSIPDSLTVSIGVGECLQTETWEEWFSRVDTALYFAKTQGRNKVVKAQNPSECSTDRMSAAAGPVRLVWHPGYECGHPRIDDQHRALFAHANALLSGLLSNLPGSEIGSLIDSLLHGIVAHFVDEESIIASAGYPGAQDHAGIHQELVEKAGLLIGRYRSGTLALGDLFQYLAYDVVAKHMLGADRDFFAYLGNAQAKQ